jgi:hypothetical protein
VTIYVLSQKLNTIRETLPAAIVHVLSNTIKACVRSGESEHLKATAILCKLETDLIYIVARHRRFIGIPILEELTSDFVATSYRVDRKTAESLANR